MRSEYCTKPHVRRRYKRKERVVIHRRSMAYRIEHERNMRRKYRMRMAFACLCACFMAVVVGSAVTFKASIELDGDSQSSTYMIDSSGSVAEAMERVEMVEKERKNKSKNKSKKRVESIWSDVQSPVGTSIYGNFEGEYITATMLDITDYVPYVAVPMERVVSKDEWNAMDGDCKSEYFYYGEKIELTNMDTGDICECEVQDCGAFGGWTSYGYDRLFDLTPWVANELDADDIDVVTWRYRV